MIQCWSCHFLGILVKCGLSLQCRSYEGLQSLEKHDVPWLPSFVQRLRSAQVSVSFLAMGQNAEDCGIGFDDLFPVAWPEPTVGLNLVEPWWIWPWSLGNPSAALKWYPDAFVKNVNVFEPGVPYQTFRIGNAGETYVSYPIAIRWRILSQQQNGRYKRATDG